ncbi:16S rRNA (uracil(1498)-N(3))-methyltransferase [Salipiger marinus]|uniref:16S rRNA (uracil(1498)-N(3))-methyltransferase n=1 Tax=Salipiger marinus TaxID=555512 RepID=UPI001E5D1627|nr:16S rRNA (uracil(1498)-N(3))-methyltransferase [Salipiger manganoxidans]MCD1617843.1 16S rRNA (uracil(1498)-N(3))-methyltransferase [Salipiger manganoxidans]MEB3418376.1 16S rRNA (uracil(1498)-N(3))-methyltransferase [Salipiger manganoxidans]
MEAKVRLFVDHPLGAGQPVPLTREQAHYLFSVMRLGSGAAVALFNGRDGEWRAEVEEAGKRGGTLLCASQTRVQGTPPDLWLIFAPIKKARTDFIVEKAVELGVRRILPVQTEFTNSERIRQDRLQAHAVEAAEQCGATFVPEVADLVRLDRLLACWPDRALVFCDEKQAGAGDPGAALARSPAPAAVLIGPEGGFSDSERARLHAMDRAQAIALGPRILRADTAAVAALTLWQAQCGDWQ